MKAGDNPVKLLPANVTAYDLLKSFAVIVMIIDHLGSYFFHDLMWLRAVGRTCVPIWFFLVGYSRSQRIPQSFWIGALILTAVEMAYGRIPLPLNILFTMILIRLTLQPVMNFVKQRPDYIYGLMAVCFLLFTPTDILFEYGTLGFIFAMLGHIVRNRVLYKPDFVMTCGIVCLTIFCLLTSIQFSLSWLQHGFNAVCSGIIIFLLISNPPEQQSYPKLDKYQALSAPLKFMGRYTLEIYVAHLILFKILLFSRIVA